MKTHMPQIRPSVAQQTQGNMPYQRASASASQLSVSAYQSLEAGLTIQTREGDVVTLAMGSFSQLDANEYNSKGQLISDGTRLAVSQNTRQIQLSSGEYFSFSVQGDLSEQELADIEGIVSGIDSIISQVAEGDMDEAVSLAMAMGSYESVSMYQADISMERSYALAARTSSVESQSKGNGYGRALAGPGQGAGITPASLEKSFLDQVSDLFEAQEEQLLAHAQQPLGQLFQHYLDQMAQGEESEEAGAPESDAVNAMETIAQSVDQMIQDRLNRFFDNTLDNLV